MSRWVQSTTKFKFRVHVNVQRWRSDVRVDCVSIATSNWLYTPLDNTSQKCSWHQKHPEIYPSLTHLVLLGDPKACFGLWCIILWCIIESCDVLSSQVESFHVLPQGARPHCCGYFSRLKFSLQRNVFRLTCFQKARGPVIVAHIRLTICCHCDFWAVSLFVWGGGSLLQCGGLL